MKKKIVIALSIFVLFTTITTKQKIVITNLSLKEIIIENNFLLKVDDIKNLLSPIYGKNLIFINNKTIANALMQNSIIRGFDVKKKYPSSLKITIYEKTPIAILQSQKDKFYLTENVDLIKFEEIKNYKKKLPYVIGNQEEFKIFYENLKKINFPFQLIKKYTFYESKRWDIETIDKKIVKLPTTDYEKSLQNYLILRKKKGFSNYRLFDYRINNQLILK